MKGLIVISAIFALMCCNAYEMDRMISFGVPNKEFDYSGKRQISGWTCGGDAVVNEYFVRLTPDRQSKSGFCWAEESFKNGEFVATIKFRISGQGASLYGDGFSAFFTQSSYHENGKMFGTNDAFYGFAIAFSTFKNTEFSRYHRDIGLYVGHGDAGVYQQDKDRAGCYSKYRFHEKRQDFSVDNYVVVKIGYSAASGKVRVAIDENNNGNFHSCIDEHVDLAPDWWKTAFMGLSASTGQLADNHDIIEVSVVNGEGDPMNVAETTNEETKKVEEEDEIVFSNLMNQHSINPAGLSKQDKALIKIMEVLDTKQKKTINKLKRELEHSLVSVDDSLNNMIKKLQQRGDVSEGRINEIEESLRSNMEKSISSELEKRLGVLEGIFKESLKKEVKKNNRKWIIPFVILLIVISVVLGFAYNKYTYLKKNHLL